MPASIVTDGASVMTGNKSGVAALLKKRVNKSLLNDHCLAHCLALSCTDTAKDKVYHYSSKLDEATVEIL